MLIPAADLVALAKSQITECSVTEVQLCLDAGTLLIDVRETAEFRKGCIRGAVHVPRGMLEFEIHKVVEIVCTSTNLPNHEQPIVVCCGTSGRSALAAQSLQSLGYRQVKSMAGGMRAWTDAQLPLEQTN
jgi:rhodanese-related sulfurtransferase